MGVINHGHSWGSGGHQASGSDLGVPRTLSGAAAAFQAVERRARREDVRRVDDPVRDAARALADARLPAGRARRTRKAYPRRPASSREAVE